VKAGHDEIVALSTLRLLVGFQELSHIFFDTDADTYTYAHTLNPMNARTHTLPYEHLRETEPAHNLEIDEVVTYAFIVHGNVSSH
jgi:hypothetical protein